MEWLAQSSTIAITRLDGCSSCDNAVPQGPKPLVRRRASKGWTLNLGTGANARHVHDDEQLQGRPISVDIASSMQTDRGLHRMLTSLPSNSLLQSPRATMLSASSGKEHCNAFAHIIPCARIHRSRSSFRRIERQNSSAASAYTATSRPVFPILAVKRCLPGLPASDRRTTILSDARA